MKKVNLDFWFICDSALLFLKFSPQSHSYISSRVFDWCYIKYYLAVAEVIHVLDDFESCTEILRTSQIIAANIAARWKGRLYIDYFIGVYIDNWIVIFAHNNFDLSEKKIFENKKKFWKRGVYKLLLFSVDDLVSIDWNDFRTSYNNETFIVVCMNDGFDELNDVFHVTSLC